jgi:hypothetical protein
VVPGIWILVSGFIATSSLVEKGFLEWILRIGYIGALIQSYNHVKAD